MSSTAPSVDYGAAPIPIRDDLALSHGLVLSHVSTAGTWWTAAERIAIAGSARHARSCPFCAERKAALSPYAVDGVHQDESGLDPTVVDVIHRVTTDPGRLSHRWYEQAIASDGLDPERFVEAIAVAVLITAIDTFARAVGVDPIPLPEPRPGAPTGGSQTDLEHERAWVPRLTPGGANWVAAFGERADVAEVERGLSLVPSELRTLTAFARVHYMAFENVTRPHYVEPGRAIDRVQTEFVASRVSAYNDCFY
ncbi:MAG: alkylhydroperoxidase-related (seleno)protein [Actinomycetota bacterium]